MNRLPTRLSCLLCLVLGALLYGCSSAPPRSPHAAASAPLVAPAASIGNEIAMRAISLLGAPYKWGGSGPTSFDCSGLVRFVHDQLGITTPRTAAEQYSAATPINLDRITPGDLLFFRISGRRISHVAIYTGDGRFIHAPQTGRPVELRTLDDDYYAERLAGAGRMY